MEAHSGGVDGGSSIIYFGDGRPTHGGIVGLGDGDSSWGDSSSTTFSFRTKTYARGHRGVEDTESHGGGVDSGPSITEFGYGGPTHGGII